MTGGREGKKQEEKWIPGVDTLTDHSLTENYAELILL